MSKVSRNYLRTEVAAYWSRRLEETDPLSAVLTFDAPAFINEAYHAWEIGSLEKALRGQLSKRQPLSGKSALDIACGMGRVTKRLARLGATTTAVDISRAMLAQSRRTCRGLGVLFVEAAADELPLRGRQFDIVTCFGLLEHLPGGPREKCLSEIARLLNRTGRAYVVVNNSRCIFLQEPRGEVQRAGYHVEMVGLEWLQSVSAGLGLYSKVLAANPGYGIVHYDMWAGRNPKRRITREKKAAMSAVLELNQMLSPHSPITHSLASHFLVECRLSP